MEFTLVVYDGCNGACHRGVKGVAVRKNRRGCTVLLDGRLYREENGLLIDPVEHCDLLVPHGLLAAVPFTDSEFTQAEADQEFRELYETDYAGESS